MPRIKVMRSVSTTGGIKSKTMTGEGVFCIEKTLKGMKMRKRRTVADHQTEKKGDGSS